jgi:predicted ABC-type ATPase
VTVKASGLAFADQARAILTQGYAKAYVAGKKDAKKALSKPVPIVDPDAAEAALPGDIQQTGEDEGIDSSEVNADDETLGESNPAYDPNTDEGDDSDITDEWDDTGDDTLDDDGQETVDRASDNVEGALFGFGALLIGAQASMAQLDAWLGTYATGLNPLYEDGFADGALANGPDDMVPVATWITEEDGVVCEMCEARDNMTWVGDEIDSVMPHPGEGGFGGSTGRGDVAICMGGPNCRCEIQYSWVTPEEAAAMQDESPFPDDNLEALSIADLLKVWRILKYSEDQPRDDHGMWTSGGGTGDQICDRIVAGEHPNVSTGQVFTILDASKTRSDPVDINELRVDGKYLFGKQGLGLSRDAMPQIPHADRQAFFDGLTKQGTSLTEDQVDSRTLKPIQDQINAKTVAGQLDLMRSGNVGRIIVSSDNYVVDGHHTWAAAVARTLESPGFTLPVTRVGMDHQALLDYADKWDASTGIQHESITQFHAGPAAQKYSDDQARDDHGRWTTGGGGGGSSTLPATDSIHKYKDAQGNWTPERDALHKQIIAGILKDLRPNPNGSTVYMTGGGSASGKSTVLLQQGYANFPSSNVAMVNDDLIQAQFPDYQEMLKSSDPAVVAAAANYAHEEASAVMSEAMQAAISGKYDVVYDGTGDGGADKLEGKIEGFRAAGATQIDAAYTTCSIDTALERDEARAQSEGRDVPQDVLINTHIGVTQSFTYAVTKGLYDKVDLWDTDHHPPDHVGEGTGKDWEVFDQEAWVSFESKVTYAVHRP